MKYLQKIQANYSFRLAVIEALVTISCSVQWLFCSGKVVISRHRCTAYHLTVLLFDCCELVDWCWSQCKWSRDCCIMCWYRPVISGPASTTAVDEKATAAATGTTATSGSPTTAATVTSIIISGHKTDFCDDSILSLQLAINGCSSSATSSCYKIITTLTATATAPAGSTKSPTENWSCQAGRSWQIGRVHVCHVCIVLY